MDVEQSTYSWISHDVTAAMLVSPNNEMAAMLVSRSNPPGIESYYYANVFFRFRWKTWLLITWVKPKNCVSRFSVSYIFGKSFSTSIKPGLKCWGHGCCFYRLNNNAVVVVNPKRTGPYLPWEVALSRNTAAQCHRIADVTRCLSISTATTDKRRWLRSKWLLSN